MKSKQRKTRIVFIIISVVLGSLGIWTALDDTMILTALQLADPEGNEILPVFDLPGFGLNTFFLLVSIIILFAGLYELKKMLTHS